MEQKGQKCENASEQFIKWRRQIKRNGMKQERQERSNVSEQFANTTQHGDGDG